MGSYLFPDFEYSLYLPYLFVSQIKRLALFDDGSHRGESIILGGLIIVIVVYYGYVPQINNGVAGPAEICIDYLTKTKWIIAQSTNKFRWMIAKKEFILLLDPTHTRLKPGVESYLLPMHGQELIARQPLWTYHRQPVREASSSSTPIDPMMVVLNRLEQGQQALTSQMGRL